MQSVLELQKSDLSLSRAWVSHRGPKLWRDGRHDITMQTKSQSKPSEVLTNHTIPQTSNQSFPLAKHLQKLQFLTWLVVLSMTWVHGMLTSTCSHTMSYSSRSKPLRASQSCQAVPGQTLDCPSLSCMPVTCLFPLQNSVQTSCSLTISPIRIQTSHIERICLNVSLTSGLVLLEVRAWYIVVIRFSLDGRASPCCTLVSGPSRVPG